MTGGRAKAALLVVALVVLAVEGYLLYGYYGRYYGDASSRSGVAMSGETTGLPATDSDDTENPKAPEAAGPAVEGEFVHRATDANSRGDYTYLSDPRIDGNPNAVILAKPSEGGVISGDATYEHNVGVWFEPGKQRWAIFNQDLAQVPAGTAFEVVVPQANRGFVHRAGLLNIVGNATYLDDPLVNGEPDAGVSVTQNWNPGGGGGVYNDHPVGVLYDGDVGKWFVYNKDGASMPEGAAFNVAVSGVAQPAG